MNYLGVDNGYHFTKTSANVMFASTIKEGHDIDLNKDTIQVRYKGTDYIIGSDSGVYAADNNKINSLVTELCTLTAIAKSFPDKEYIECKLIAGLPVAYYQNQKTDFRNKLLGLNGSNITLGKKTHHIHIADVYVFPQSVGIIFTDNNNNVKTSNNLVIDIGGGTVDTSHFRGLKMESWRTMPLGMLILYSKIAQFINSEFEQKYDEPDIYGVIQRGSFPNPKNGFKLESTECFDFIIKGHVADMAAKIKRDFKVGTMDNIFIIGGGGIELYPYIKNHFPNAILGDSAQFSNALGFKYMGELKDS